MKQWKIRILILLFCILTFPAAQVQAAPEFQEPSPGTGIAGLDCVTCHGNIFELWETSAHGVGLTCEQCHLSDQANLAKTGHNFQGDAQECMDCHTTGHDSENATFAENDIHCTACHNPIPENHPLEPAPIDRSVDLCGQCHIQARFDWQTSAHGTSGVACVTCHNQHSTSLKEEDISAQCASCHGKRVSAFSHSEHGESGLSCADCHLALLDGPLMEGNAKRDHSFRVEISVCSACHSYQLHNPDASSTPTGAIQLIPEGAVDSMTTNINDIVSESPEHLNHFTLASVFSLIGIGIGAISIPLLKSNKTRNNKK